MEYFFFNSKQKINNSTKQLPSMHSEPVGKDKHVLGAIHVAPRVVERLDPVQVRVQVHQHLVSYRFQRYTLPVVVPGLNYFFQ